MTDELELENNDTKNIGENTNTQPKDIVHKKQQRVILDESIIVDEAWDDAADITSMPSTTNEDLTERLGQLPNINLMSDSKSKEWAEVLRSGQELTTYGDVFVDSLTRENSEYHQSVEHNGTKLQAKAPIMKSIENENIKGERAILRAARELGLGTTFQIPCWHSGIWITLKPPTEIELIELNRAMIASKIRLGYNTYGLAYSNITSYTVDHLVDFIKNHIYATSVKNEELPIDKLMDELYVHDLYTLIWGMAATMYPNGFQMKRACSANPEKCNHMTEEVINLAKLQNIDISQLNEWQKNHMSIRRPFERDLASIKKYKDEMLALKNNRIKISRNDSKIDVHVNLKPPTISQYLTEGQAWISGIIDKINELMAENEPDTARNTLVQRYGQSSSMRQYTQWIESIEMGSNTIDDTETIRSLLDMMSSDDYLRETFLVKVVDYINKSTISVIGIPSYECPKCGEIQTQQDNIKSFKNIVPIDVIQYFFSLTTQRVQRITIR